MDPDACIEEMRRLTSTIFGRKLVDAEAERLAELFCGLDSWLKSGNGLPKDWQRKAK